MRRVRNKGLCRFPSADHPDPDPAPRYDQAPAEGHKDAWLVADRSLITQVLRDPKNFGNAPYAPIGGSRFMLAMEAAPVGTAHARQQAYVKSLLDEFNHDMLQQVSTEAANQALLVMLQSDSFDLAELGALTALRGCQLWMGFGAADLPLLRAAALDGYAALVHQIVGRHFTADDTVLPRARPSLAQLTRRTAALLTEYRELAWQPREARGQMPQRLARLHWPEGVEPPDTWGLSAMGDPLLKRMALAPGDFSVQELATMVVGLVVGTVGNVQAGSCLLMARWMSPGWRAVEAQRRDLALVARGRDPHNAVLQALISQGLACMPPVAMLPRRALAKVTLGGQTIQPGEDLLLWMSAAARADPAPAAAACPHAGFAFGDPAPAAGLVTGTATGTRAPHACLGQDVAQALMTALLRRVLQLDGLAERLDPVTGRPEGLSQRWGFACVSYPLRHQRKRFLAQQPLNVFMRVKAPVDLHASALRRVIADGAPRIQRALAQSNHVHFAWFELLDQGRVLALHTVYDGSFDDYVQHFALEVDDLFDQLFQHIEGAPPLPVSEHPGAFVDVIRAYHQPQLAGYFFSAYPGLEVSEANRLQASRT